jgi:hypothetical protein
MTVNGEQVILKKRLCRSGFSRELFSIGKVFTAANNAKDAK